MPKGAGQDKLQPAYDRGPHSSGTVDGTSAPVPSWSVPLCRMAWLYDQVPPPCPGAAQEPWCCQGHQQWGGVNGQLLILKIIDSGYFWWHHCQKGFRRGFDGHAGKGISRVDLSRSVLDFKIELCEL